MWSKINELSRQSLSQMQIALKLDISRDTVRRYQRMSEKEFEEHIKSEALRRKRKLEPYEGFIKDLLQETLFLSASQIYDRLQEHYPDLPEVSERTVYNTVCLIREREELPKTGLCDLRAEPLPSGSPSGAVTQSRVGLCYVDADCMQPTERTCPGSGLLWTFRSASLMSVRRGRDQRSRALKRSAVISLAFYRGLWRGQRCGWRNGACGERTGARPTPLEWAGGT